jgi:hypothetical protein
VALVQRIPPVHAELMIGRFTTPISAGSRDQPRRIVECAHQRDVAR